MEESYTDLQQMYKNNLGTFQFVIQRMLLIKKKYLRNVIIFPKAEVLEITRKFLNPTRTPDATLCRIECRAAGRGRVFYRWKLVAIYIVTQQIFPA